jgi:hypothetical protein
VEFYYLTCYQSPSSTEEGSEEDQLWKGNIGKYHDKMTDIEPWFLHLTLSKLFKFPDAQFHHW